MVFACLALLVAGAEPSVCGEATVVSDRLHVRQKPDKDSRSVLILLKGVTLNVVRDTGDGWLEVERKGVRGFVRNRDSYIRVTAAPQTEKIAQREAASSEPSKDFSEQTRKKKTIDSKIRMHQGEIRKFSEKEQNLLKDLDGMDRNLNRSRVKVAALKKDLSSIRESMKTNSREKQALLESLKRNEDYISKRVVALYKLYHVGRMNVLASAESMYDLINRQRSLEFILKEDENILAAHLENLARLKLIESRLAEHEKRSVALQEDVRGRISDITDMKKKRSVMLSEVRQKKNSGMAAIVALKEAARDLDRTLKALERKTAGEADKGPFDEHSFTARKGRLRLPVKGKVVSFFGRATDSEFNVETFHSGIQVRADRGEPVQAVGEGQVLFSDWLKGYGNLIIIDHGNSYYSVYGHTEEVFKHKGERVEDREVIATVGDTGSLSGPLLHFEIRHRGEPLDPMAWLKRGDG